MPLNQNLNSRRCSAVAAGLLAVIVSQGRSTPAAATDRPNVLMIFVDDLRTSLGCYGDPLAKSPRIDRLASTSRLFLRAYCQQAVCGPSRSSLLTGLLPDNTGVWHNRDQFRDRRPELVTLPELFKNHGYHSQSLGKVFSGNEREDDPQSWTVPSQLRDSTWRSYVLPENRKTVGKGPAYEIADVPDEEYPDGKLAERAVHTLAALKRNQPFFLAVGFFKPHLPFNAPRQYWDLYDPAVFKPDGEPARTIGAPPFAYPDHLELAGYQDISPNEHLTSDQAQRLRHGYYACVSYTDAQVGKLLDELSRLRLEESTIVVLVGDHGYSLGEADHWCKDTNFELDTHVPLMIRVPGQQHPGTGTEALTELVDLYPTLAKLCRLPLPEQIDGSSLVPILEEPKHPGRKVVLSQFSRPFRAGSPTIMGYSIRTDRHRYTRWIDWNTQQALAEELYDYASSQSVDREAQRLVERRNVAGEAEYAALCEELKAQMDTVIQNRVRPRSSGSRD